MADNENSTFLSLLFGAAVGGALALLLAPQTGKKTREMLKRTLDDAELDAVDFAQKARDQWGQGLEESRTVLDKAKTQLDKGKEMYEQARNKMQDALGHGKEVMGHSLEELEKRKEQISSAINAGRKAMDDAKKEV